MEKWYTQMEAKTSIVAEAKRRTAIAQDRLQLQDFDEEDAEKAKTSLETAVEQLNNLVD